MKRSEPPVEFETRHVLLPNGGQMVLVGPPGATDHLTDEELIADIREWKAREGLDKLGAEEPRP